MTIYLNMMLPEIKYVRKFNTKRKKIVYDTNKNTQMLVDIEWNKQL